MLCFADMHTSQDMHNRLGVDQGGVCGHPLTYLACCLVPQVADIDFFDSQPFPSFDVVTMGMILHDWGLPKKQLLMQKVSHCCQAGSALRAPPGLSCIDDLHAATPLSAAAVAHMAAVVSSAASISSCTCQASIATQPTHALHGGLRCRRRLRPCRPAGPSSRWTW